jgi:hypothetical protein
MHLFVFLTYRVRLSCLILPLVFIWSKARDVPNLESPQSTLAVCPNHIDSEGDESMAPPLPLSLRISPCGFEIVAHRSTDRIDKI